VAKGVELGADVIIVDTAGRLQNKSTLMEELSKVIRVIERKAPVTETLLVLDATTGQNGLNQAEVFGQSVNLTGIVLTKFDGTAKGGIVFAVQQRLGVPVKLVGIGESADDLISFNAMEFVDSLLS
jgi:fused signal recognition particle receptor